MADYLAEAIKAAQGQAIASNPYAQFGSMFGQAKMPANNGDAWSNLAGIAAQQAIAGLASGFGQADVNNQMQRIGPQIQQLYANPSAANMDGIDSALAATLRNAALAEEAATKQEFNKFMGQETYKVGIQPDVDAKRADSFIKGLQAQDEMRKRGMLAPVPVVAAAPAEAAAQIVAANPAPVAKPVTPAATPTSNIGDFVRIKQQFLASDPTMTVDEATKKADKYIADQAEKDLKITESGLRTSEDTNKQKLAAETADKNELAKRLGDTAKSLSSVDLAVSNMEGAVKYLPDWGGLFGGVDEFVTKNISARLLPESTPWAKDANRELDAVQKVKSTQAAILGPVRKELMPGALTEKELAFLLDMIPSEYNTKSQQQATMGILSQTKDLLKFQSAVLSMASQKGWTNSQTEQWLNSRRQMLGGTLLDTANGKLKPEVYGMMQAWGAV